MYREDAAGDCEPAPSGGHGRLLGWVGLLAAAIWVLTALGQGSLGVPAILDAPGWRAWVVEREAVTIVFAALRLLTLAMAWYLLGATAVGLVARLVSDVRLIAAADVLAVPMVRQLLQAAFGAGLATASLAAGSGWIVPEVSSASTPAAALPDTAAAAGPDHQEPVVTTAPPAPLPDPAPAQGPPVPIPEFPMPAVTSETWTVRPGDHLWSIAQQTLARAGGREPSDEQTAAYWQRLIAQNRSRLADPGNPDLILAGQVFELPQVPRA